MAHKRKKRTPKARYKIMMGRLGPSLLLVNSKGRVVNTINGGPQDTVEDMFRFARKYFPEAREVK